MPRSCRAALIATLTTNMGASAQVGFQEVGANRGIQPYASCFGLGAGFAAADYDDDGDIDFFLPHALNLGDRLYVNDGAGAFTHHNVTGDAALSNTRAALWLDYDGDADLDLLTLRDYWHISAQSVSTIRLYRQDGPLTFIDVTAAAGLDDHMVIDDDSHIGGACAGDIDNDGDIDLYVSFWNQWNNQPAQLYRNNGDGTFQNISLASGIITTGETTFWQPMMVDVNADGFLDIYQAVDFEPNILWRNQGDGTFLDRASAHRLDNLMNDMGVAIGDFDNDADFDIYVTNIETIGRHNVLLRNSAPLTGFDEISQTAGCAQGRWGWGATFFDCDNNGWLDIAATNGYFNAEWIVDRSRFFLNSGAGPVWFTEVGQQIGFDDTLWGSALVAADIDRDGDLDLLQTTMNGPFRILDNTPGPAAESNHYIVVRPRMPGANHRAIGAVVELEAGGLTMTRLIHAGTSFLGQEPAEAHFGLGQASLVDRLTVRWPGRNPTTFNGLAADQVLVITPPCPPGDANADNVVNILDLNIVLGSFGLPGLRAADVNGDASVDLADLNQVLGNFGTSCPD